MAQTKIFKRVRPEYSCGPGRQGITDLFQMRTLESSLLKVDASMPRYEAR